MPTLSLHSLNSYNFFCKHNIYRFLCFSFIFFILYAPAIMTNCNVYKFLLPSKSKKPLKYPLSTLFPIYQQQFVYYKLYYLKIASHFNFHTDTHSITHLSTHHTKGFQHIFFPFSKKWIYFCTIFYCSAFVCKLLHIDSLIHIV